METTGFPQFQWLPAEIRCTIWAFALPPPSKKLRIVQHEDSTLDGRYYRFPIPPMPAVFHTTSESRAEALRHGGKFVRTIRKPDEEQKSKCYYGDLVETLEVDVRWLFMPQEIKVRFREAKSVIMNYSISLEKLRQIHVLHWKSGRGLPSLHLNLCESSQDITWGGISAPEA